MANTTQLIKDTSYGNVMRTLKEKDSSLPGGGRYDKVSLWTLASDIKMDDGSNLEEYYEDIKERGLSTISQHREVVSFLRDMDLGVTEYTDVNTLIDRIESLDTHIVEALEEMSGRTLSDTSLQGISSFIRDLDIELQEVLESLNITATGTSDIVDALDSLS